MAEIKIRAERRAGELLAEVERVGHRPPKAVQTGGLRVKTYTETIEDAGIADSTARRWQAEASIPEPIFEEPAHDVAPRSANGTTARRREGRLTG